MFRCTLTVCKIRHLKPACVAYYTFLFNNTPIIIYNAHLLTITVIFLLVMWPDLMYVVDRMFGGMTVSDPVLSLMLSLSLLSDMITKYSSDANLYLCFAVS